MRRNLHISAILTLTDVMAASTFKCNYETTDNEPRTTDSAEFSFIKSVPHLLSDSKREMKSVPHLLSDSKREMFAYDSAQSKGLYFSL